LSLNYAFLLRSEDDTTGTDLGNKYKAEKSLESYDEDATKTLDLLQSLEMCTGRIASTYARFSETSLFHFSTFF
jgi:hypothetical protein